MSISCIQTRGDLPHIECENLVLAQFCGYYLTAEATNEDGRTDGTTGHSLRCDHG